MPVYPGALRHTDFSSTEDQVSKTTRDDLAVYSLICRAFEDFLYDAAGCRISGCEEQIVHRRIRLVSHRYRTRDIGKACDFQQSLPECFRDSFILRLQKVRLTIREQLRLLRWNVCDCPPRIAFQTGTASPPVTLREIDGFHAYGTVTKLTTVDGRIPDAQRWLPGVVSARLNIRVRSTTARML